MFTLLGPKHRYCDRATRRNFLKVGGLAMGGLSLPTLLKAEEQQGIRRSHKSVIMVYLSGGMAHQDTFDLKPDAPDEIRGEFKPISTVVPGLQVGELLPKMAAVMDRVSLVRSIVGLRDEHSSFQNLTGYTMNVAQREGRPNSGSVIARLAGPVDPVVPPFVDLFPTMQHKPYNSPGPGMLGNAAGGAKADGEDLASMKLRFVSNDEFTARRRLLAGFDDFRRSVDSAGVERLDAAYRRAFDVLTSSKLVNAMDVEKEDPAVRDRYGRGSPQHQGDGAPGVERSTADGPPAGRGRRPMRDRGLRLLGHARQQFRRAEAPVATVRSRNLGPGRRYLRAWARSRRHGGRVGRIRPHAEDQQGRRPRPLGTGEFRPAVRRRHAQPGRSSARPTRSAPTPRMRRVPYLDVLATIYHNLGIDPHTFVKDLADRPVSILPEGSRPIAELV